MVTVEFFLKTKHAPLILIQVSRTLQEVRIELGGLFHDLNSSSVLLPRLMILRLVLATRKDRSTATAPPAAVGLVGGGSAPGAGHPRRRPPANWHPAAGSGLSVLKSLLALWQARQALVTHVLGFRHRQARQTPEKNWVPTAWFTLKPLVYTNRERNL